MGVQGAGTGGGVLIFGEQPFQLCIFLCPTIFAGVKGIRQTAPAHILRKHLLLLGGGTPVLLFQLEQGTDSFNVPGIFLLCATLAQMVVRDVEVPGRLRCRMFRLDCRRFCAYRLNYNVKRQIVFLGGVYGNRFFSTNWPGSIWFVLPQALLELLLIDNFVIPRLPVRTGVDANIRFAYIADFPFDGSGRKVNDNIVTDLVIGQGVFHHFLFLFVQLPDNRQRFLPENRHPQVGQCHILQGNLALIKIHSVNPKFPAIHIDDGADGQIVLFVQMFSLVMSPIFVQSGKVNIIARRPQFF